jgi:hypothetical protein
MSRELASSLGLLLIVGGGGGLVYGLRLARLGMGVSHPRLGTILLICGGTAMVAGIAVLAGFDIHPSL